MSIDAQCYKGIINLIYCLLMGSRLIQLIVFPGTEEQIYNDKFFSRLNIVVNALDNIEARRYMDR